MTAACPDFERCQPAGMGMVWYGRGKAAQAVQASLNSYSNVDSVAGELAYVLLS